MLLDIYSEKLVQMNVTSLSLPMRVPRCGACWCSHRHLSEHHSRFLQESRKMGGGAPPFGQVAEALTKKWENWFQFLTRPRRTHAYVS